MILGIISLLTSVVLVVMLAYGVHHVVRAHRVSVDLVSFLFLLIFFATLFMLLVGLAGFLSPIPILVVSLAGVALLMSLPPFRHVIRHFRDDWTAFWAQAIGWWGSLPRWLRWLTVFSAAISVLRFSFLILSLPPFVWDSLTYHLTNVAEWTQQGAIVLFDTPITRIYTPANFEVLTLWFTIFNHHDVVIETAGIPVYLLAILSVYSIGRTIGISRASAWFGAMAYAATPALLMAVTGTKNDPHMAAYYLAALSILLNLTVTRKDARLRNPTGQILLILLILLLAFGTKAYLLHIAPGLVLIAILGVDKGAGWKRWGKIVSQSVKQLTANGKWFRILLLVILISGLFLGLFWNVRNWVLTGNPFYPYGVKIEGEKVISGAERTADMSIFRLTENLKSLMWKFGDRRLELSPDLTDTTGWGWFVYGVGLPALTWGLLKNRKIRVLFAGFLLSMILIFLSIRPSPWNMRYLLWFPAIFAIAFAAIMDEIIDLDLIPGRLILVLSVFCLGLNFLPTINYGLISPQIFNQILSIPLSERGSADLRVHTPAEYESTLGIVPRDVVLGYNVSANGFVYPLYRPDFSQRLAYIPVSVDGTCGDVAENMRIRGTRYLFVAPVHTSDAVFNFMHACGEEGTIIRERSINLYVIKDTN